MYSCNMSSFMFFISVILTFCLFHNVCPSCVFHDGKYDLSALDRPTGWPVAGHEINGTVSRYEINLCHPLNYSSPLKEGCPKSSVCQIVGNKSISFGNALENKSEYAIADNIGNGFNLFVLTRKLCSGSGIYRATIFFACGPNLGAPELILKAECQVNFYWRTSAACPNKAIKHQVPCYVIDNEGYKRDLSHLILKNGGYYVNTPNPTLDFFINVCADITLDNKTKGCPENTSACSLMGSQHLSFGNLHDGLQFGQEGLTLSYTTNEIYSSPPAGCHLNPKTTVLFKCPFRGHSQPPKLISDSNCQYEVEWETEYACPENILKGSLKTCQFSTELHGVEIDLSPLKRKPIYNINSISNTTNSFSLSVCGGLGSITCGGKNWKSISVCANNSNSSQISGTTEGAELMYADGEVILTYPKGDACEDGMEQSSVINFICDPQAADDGMGEPQHVSSEHCINRFEWKTKHACLKHSLDTPCSVTYNKKKINLEKLQDVGGAWEAIDLINGYRKNGEYYINVCSQVSNLSKLSNCGEDSSACVLHDNGTYLNLGNFTSPPVYDVVSDSVRLNYTGGSPCKNGKHWHSTIEFICRPGHILLEPYLTRINETDCHYEFEWQTAEACPEGMIEGSNCKVYDANLGINYDLTPLKSKVYKLDTDSYKYYIGVCEPVLESPCSSSKISEKNVGVCQVDKFNQSSWKTGEASSRLSYMDGVVNLTYLSGDPYNDQNQTSRSTIIVFICDSKAGNGNPEFIEEVNFAYVFHWYTSLVCPHSVGTECLVHDPFSHFVYDLSGLALSAQNWMTIINEDNKERQIYLNVCRSLSQPTDCDSSAAACITEISDDGEKVVISNVGSATTPPLFDSPGHLTLKYDNGNPCTAFGQNITYSTVIHFLCAENKMSKSGLQFLSKIGACEYTFLWTTKAACPTDQLQAKDSCQLTDPDSGFTFDLTPLHLLKHFYTVSSPSRIFNFNVCGKVLDGCAHSPGARTLTNVSVCEVNKDGRIISEIAIADSYILSYSAGKGLSLTYKSDSHVLYQEVVIKFPCHNSTSVSEPKFIHYEEGQFIFEMKTSLSCIPTHFECNFVDKAGNEYDLSPLAKYSNGNWEIVDHRPEYSHLRYHINFCRPLNKVSAYKCPGGASAACQTNTNESESSGHDLGSQMMQPIVNNKGIVAVHYTDGSYCHNGMFKRSTRINLFCSAEQGELKFLGETSECEYIFSLHTPVACPIQSSLGFNCIVKDPIFGYTFDLNPLKSKNNDYNVSVGDYIYSFNVCGKLNGFSNECANAGACQMKPGNGGFSKNLGLPSDTLVYRKGLITLEYTSGTGNCHGKYNRSTKITFTCHHAHEDKDGPTYVAEAEDCSYLFEWPTVHACPPFDVIECSVVDNNGIYYDLSKLSLPNDNYYVKYPAFGNKTFVINICRSIVHTPNSLCPYTSASCLLDSSQTDEPINLGRVNNAPYFENGKIKINYTSGDPCNDGKVSSARFMQTIIEFSCDPTMIDSEPEFIGKDGCSYYFDWATAYACPSKAVDNIGNCSAQDPVTGYLFNLTSLKTHGLFKTQISDHLYYLNICGSNHTNPCGPDAGICQEELTGAKRHWSGGKPNDNLIYNDGILYLNYSSGDSCHNGKFQRNTIVEFHCGHGIGEPKFLYESYDCTYFFSWKTELACQTLLHCAIKNGSNYYDLTSLAESYHTAGSTLFNDDASYYISICNSLPKIHNVSCPPEAAICRVTKDSSSSAIITESLGRVEYPPFVDFMGYATVIYTNGSTCLKNTTLNNRARIIFLCDSEAGAGEPVLLLHEYDECFYLFEWRTSIVCPEKPEDPQLFSTCFYIDNARGLRFDLRALQKTGVNSFYEISNEGNQNGTFFFNICGNLNGLNLTKCDGAGVCGREGNNTYNYGIATSQKFSFDGQRLRLSFYDGDDCPTGIKGKRTAEVFFMCDPSAGKGRPVLHKKYTCLTVIMWKTALVCQNMQQLCAFDKNGIHYDFNLLSSLTHNWNTSDDKNLYWINLCRGVEPIDDAAGCPGNAAVCMWDSNGDHMSLGIMQTMQVKSVNSTDLLLMFESGDKQACASVNPELSPFTRIFMRCGTSLGKPKIFSGPDSKCYYDFVWKSSLACADKAEEVMMEKDGLIKDKRLEYSFDIQDILNRTFYASGITIADEYLYKINLSGVSQNLSNPCAKAAVCQTKNDTDFLRDIGSLDSRTFIIRGSELHLLFVSHTKPCGKNNLKNVTTLINMQCVSATGIGSPKFLYESGNCDYVFEWETIAVCPDFHRKKVPVNPEPNPFKDEQPSSHKAEIVIGSMFGIVAILIITYIVMKAERRAIVSSRFRSLFGRVNLPYFRYKRGDILTELQSDF